jgi:large subunit ribosomal protein L15
MPPANPEKEDAAQEGAPKAAGASSAGKTAAQSPAAQSPAAQRPSAAAAPESAESPSGREGATGDSGRGLKLHHLRPAPGARTAKTRLGRGEASKGKTAGRGTKGTRARNTMRLGFEGGQMPLYRRVPKLKGFSNAGFGTTYQVVNTGRLAELYPSGGDVTPDDLVARGAIRKGERVKVLADGDLSVALQVSAHAFSASARERITGAGGSVTEL